MYSWRRDRKVVSPDGLTSEELGDVQSAVVRSPVRKLTEPDELRGSNGKGGRKESVVQMELVGKLWRSGGSTRTRAVKCKPSASRRTGRNKSIDEKQGMKVESGATETERLRDKESFCSILVLLLFLFSFSFYFSFSSSIVSALSVRSTSPLSIMVQPDRSRSPDPSPLRHRRR